MKQLRQLLILMAVTYATIFAATPAPVRWPTIDELMGDQTGKAGWIWQSDGKNGKFVPSTSILLNPNWIASTGVTAIRNKPIGVNTQTGNYSLVATDQGKLIVMSSDVDATLTIPLDSAATTMLDGTIVYGIATGKGIVRIVAAEGVTMVSKDNAFKAYGGGTRWNLIRMGANRWCLEGKDLVSNSTTTWLGRKASLVSKVDGPGPLTYQWSKDGSPIAGATNDKLEFASVVATDAGVYILTVTNVGGTTTSEPYTMIITP